MANLPPPPLHILRTHSASVSAVSISADNERLYSGDGAGVVAVTSTRTLRALALWPAHTDSVLGVEEWGPHIITHGRDNKLHVWRRAREPAAALGGAAALGRGAPELRCSMDVNALNYCRFSLLPLPPPPPSPAGEHHALLALPNLVDSSVADIWVLPSCERRHAAIGKAQQPRTQPVEASGRNPLGIIMTMNLIEVPHPHTSGGPTQLRLLCTYENGSATMWGYTRYEKETSVEGVGWEPVWTVKKHVESVMATAISRDASFALTVSADHFICKYNILSAEQPEQSDASCTIYPTKSLGNASIAIRDDGRVCAIGGWDGKIRLYSTRSMKPLGTLNYHKKSCRAVAFARSQPSPPTDRAPESNVNDDGDDDLGDDEKVARSRWLVAASQDQRVTVWPLIEFGGGGSST